MRPTAITSIIADSAATGMSCRSGAPYRSSRTSVIVVAALETSFQPPAWCVVIAWCDEYASGTPPNSEETMLPQPSATSRRLG